MAGYKMQLEDSPFSVENHTRAFEEFLQYKTRVPVRGAILLNEAMDSTVLVKGWKKGANWSFPRGKINKDEDDLECAIREVYEETGYDLHTAGLVPPNREVKHIEITMREQQMRLYVFRDVPMDTHFAPRTRKEISKISWYNLSELPAFRKKGNNHNDAAAAVAAANANKFYMVAPFLVPLKKWVVQQKKRDNAKNTQQVHFQPQNLYDEPVTEDDAWARTEPAPAPPTQLSNHSMALLDVLKSGARSPNLTNSGSEARMVPDLRNLSIADSTILVLKSEYDNLKDVYRYHANLRHNLINGGVTESTIALLSSDESMRKQGTSASTDNCTSFAEFDDQRQSCVGHYDLDCLGQHGGSSEQKGHRRTQQQYHSMGAARKAETVEEAVHTVGQFRVVENVTPVATNVILEDAPLTAAASLERPPRPPYERMATRTVVLYDLAEATTHGDITDAVRGGMLLEVFLKSHDRSVQVSFLDAESARAFFDHARRHDLYIRQRRVSIKWSDRQFVLAGHIGHKVANGATRNLVIRRCSPKLTAESIRDDLEHIHNLVVVRITFVGGSCFIQTNSVNNAIFARNCMMSRFKYKGSRIDWDTDACAAPLETLAVPKIRGRAVAPRKMALNPMANRFKMLEPGDTSGEDTDDDGASALTPYGSAHMAV
ncbi:hypothetical protein ACHAQH_007990 [Verticillium albo-atrum]